ncbi:MAG: polysaccharide biosynthesis/export family protein [Bacteroidota bacterium]
MHLRVLLFLLFPLLFSSCGAYRLNQLFRTPEDFKDPRFQEYVAQAEENYRVRKFDFLTIEVYTNGGERLIDPDKQYPYEPQPGALPDQQQGQGGGNPQNAQFFNSPSQLLGQRRQQYIVDEDGEVIFPQIGATQVEGLTLYQVDSLLATKYEPFYKKPLVVTRFVNKRVIVLGALGSHIIPLSNENTTLFEIIAEAGDITMDANANRVSIIRNAHTGDPVIKQIDLTTWAGIGEAELIMRPNDVVYIEPRRRIAREFLTDFGAFLGSISTALTLTLTTILLIDRSN